jgi:hypothetical protein
VGTVIDMAVEMSLLPYGKMSVVVHSYEEVTSALNFSQTSFAQHCQQLRFPFICPFQKTNT